MLFDNRTQALRRALAGGLVGVAAHLLLGYLLGSIPLFGPARFTGFVFPNCNFRFQPEWLGVLVSFALFALFGAELGIATLPFAGTGQALVKRTLAHFLTMAATVALWVGLNAGAERVLLPLVLLAVFYALIWLGRWVGWYAEVAAIREKLGLSPGPSPLKWKETLPYVPFALLLCLLLPAGLSFFDAPDVPVLTGLIYLYLLLPVGSFCSGLSSPCSGPPVLPALYSPTVISAFNRSGWGCLCPSPSLPCSGQSLGSPPCPLPEPDRRW